MSPRLGATEAGRRSRGILFRVGFPLLLIITLAACAGSSQSVPPAAASPKTQTHLFQDCQATTGALLAVETDLDSRLNAGMVLSEYRTAVQNVNVEYGKINVASEDSACVSKVGVPTETALNEYSAALRSWNDCVTDMACGKTVLHDLVQGHWSTASGKVAEAKEGMQTLKVADSWSS